MHIGFVAEPYEEQHASGMGYAVLETMQNLARFLPEGDRLTIYSCAPVRRDFLGANVRNIAIPKNFVAKLWYFFTLKDNVDVLLYMAPMMPLLAPRRIRTVPICQELANMKLAPEGIIEPIFTFARDRILMPRCFRRAVRIVTPSQATKTDIIKF